MSDTKEFMLYDCVYMKFRNNKINLCDRINSDCPWRGREGMGSTTRELYDVMKIFVS